MLRDTLIKFLDSIRAFVYHSSIFQDRAIHFGETLGDQVKGRSPRKQKLLIEVPNVVHVKENVLSFNMILISSP